MIRNTMLGLSLLALTGASAFAAPMVHPAQKNKVVAQAPAGDAAKDGASATKEKKAKHSKKAKGDTTKTDAPATK